MGGSGKFSHGRKRLFFFFQGCQDIPFGIVEVRLTWFMIESDFGGAELSFTKVTRHRVVYHSLVANCSYKIAMDRMSQQSFQMEIEDD
jgi:hypothetical protein